MERGKRIELSALAWKAKVLPLYEPRIDLVPPKRLELSHLSIPEPKSGASTNFAKGACFYLSLKIQQDTILVSFTVKFLFAVSILNLAPQRGIEPRTL